MGRILEMVWAYRPQIRRAGKGRGTERFRIVDMPLLWFDCYVLTSLSGRGPLFCGFSEPVSVVPEDIRGLQVAVAEDCIFDVWYLAGVRRDTSANDNMTGKGIPIA